MKTINLELSGEIMMEGINVEYYQSRIEEDSHGCWLFNGKVCSGYNRGYGMLKFKGKEYRAHRFYYEAFFGPLKSTDILCHSCDVRHCVKPNHLWIGTRAENMADMKQKGRSAIGTKNGFSKLTEKQVEKIISLKGTMLQREIAVLFNIGQPHVHKIHTGQIWKHIN